MAEMSVSQVRKILKLMRACGMLSKKDVKAMRLFLTVGGPIAPNSRVSEILKDVWLMQEEPMNNRNI